MKAAKVVSIVSSFGGAVAAAGVGICLAGIGYCAHKLGKGVDKTLKKIAEEVDWNSVCNKTEKKETEEKTE